MAKKTTTKKPTPERVPGAFHDFVTRYPALGRAHEGVAKAVDGADPLDAKTLALIKIGICIGAGLESALRSHVRRAMKHGAKLGRARTSTRTTACSRPPRLIATR